MPPLWPREWPKQTELQRTRLMLAAACRHFDRSHPHAGLGELAKLILGLKPPPPAVLKAWERWVERVSSDSRFYPYACRCAKRLEKSGGGIKLERLVAVLKDEQSRCPDGHDKSGPPYPWRDIPPG